MADCALVPVRAAGMTANAVALAPPGAVRVGVRGQSAGMADGALPGPRVARVAIDAVLVLPAGLVNVGMGTNAAGVAEQALTVLDRPRVTLVAVTLAPARLVRVGVRLEACLVARRAAGPGGLRRVAPVAVGPVPTADVRTGPRFRVARHAEVFLVAYLALAPVKRRPDSVRLHSPQRVVGRRHGRLMALAARFLVVTRAAQSGICRRAQAVQAYPRPLVVCRGDLRVHVQVAFLAGPLGSMVPVTYADDLSPGHRRNPCRLLRLDARMAIVAFQAQSRAMHE